MGIQQNNFVMCGFFVILFALNQSISLISIKFLSQSLSSLFLYVIILQLSVRPDVFFFHFRVERYQWTCVFLQMFPKCGHACVGPRNILPQLSPWCLVGLRASSLTLIKAVSRKLEDILEIATPPSLGAAFKLWLLPFVKLELSHSCVADVPVPVPHTPLISALGAVCFDFRPASSPWIHWGW